MARVAALLQERAPAGGHVAVADAAGGGVGGGGGFGGLRGGRFRVGGRAGLGLARGAEALPLPARGVVHVEEGEHEGHHLWVGWVVGWVVSFERGGVSIHIRR